MEKLTKVRVKKYLDTIKVKNKKFVTCHYLSMQLGIKEEVIREELATFDDLIRIMDEYNLVEIIPAMEEFLSSKTKREKTTKKYASIAEFVYENMTSSGGLVNKYVKLDADQLHDLNLLVKKELKKVGKK